MTSAVIDQFRAALAARGIVPPAQVIADGMIHRCDAEGKNGRGDASYLLHLDGLPAGGFENFRDGLGWENWRANAGRPFTASEESAYQAKVQAARRQRDEADIERRADTKRRAQTIWAAAIRMISDHAYLNRKHINSHGARLVGESLVVGGMECMGALVVPMRDAAGEVCSLQFIGADGSKRYLPGPKPAGLYCSIGKPGAVVCIAEGFATGASIAEATGYAVAVAFDTGGLESVAMSMREKMPDAKIIVCADDDYRTAGNPGMAKATTAATAIRGYVARPDFGADRPDGATDFNDLAAHVGPDAVRRCINAAVMPASAPRPVTDALPMAGLVCALDVTPESVDWFWKDWLAAGKLHILAGAPGTGKTTVALALAATMTAGGCWPDGTPAKLGNVLVWSSEDSQADVIVPRLVAMGADRSRIHFIETALDGDGRRPFDPATDIGLLRTTLDYMALKPSLLVVDPIVSAVAGDSHKGAETRRSLQPLVDLAAHTGCAVLGISHFSKGTAGRDVIERVTGSLAFGALARLVFAAAKMPDDQGGGRVFARAKSNLGPDGGGFEYDLQQTELISHRGIWASGVVWGDPIEGTARDILAKAEVNADPEERTAVDEAMSFLTLRLAGCAVEAKKLQREADDAGLSWATVRRAANALLVIKKPDGMQGSWRWSLTPELLKNPRVAQPKAVSKSGDDEQVWTDETVRDDASAGNAEVF